MNDQVNVTVLQQALESNQRLQGLILKEIQQISHQKAQNRRQVASLIAARSSLLLRGNDESIVARQTTTHKWNLPFFSYQTQRPSDNEDVKRRKELESKTFFHHTQPPWSAKETAALEKAVDNATDKDDFVSIAQHLAEKRILRNAEECRIQYRKLKMGKPKAFTKKESLHISEQVHLQRDRPNWTQIAAAIQRSPWECFVAYQTKIRPAQSNPWTLGEDQLLLKYIAAAGPQFVSNEKEVRHLTSRFFSKSKTAVQNRINQSLLNPNFVNETWTEDEERKLCLLLKVYRDAKNTLYMASTHLARSSKSVIDKWRRALDPSFSSRPFTKEEDQKLLNIMRTESIGWPELSERHFPGRHPQRLMGRFFELAKDEDLVKQAGPVVKGRRKRSAPITVEELTEDDFVVQVKKKKTKKAKDMEVDE